MAFDSDELLKIAQNLFKDDGLSESEIRTILNRCYYSCFLKVKGSVGNMGLTDKFTHGDALDEIQDFYLRNVITKLFSYRVVADYSLNKKDTHFSTKTKTSHTVKTDDTNYAIEAIQGAEDFLDKL